MRLPFHEWQCGVLREINCAPTQIHPNGWAAMQAFHLICSAAGLTPTAHVFMHFYKLRPTKSKGWISFVTSDRKYLKLYSDSFKNFKNGFFKVVIGENGRSLFFDGAGRPKFSFYWTSYPPRVDPFPEAFLSPAEARVLALIKSLSELLPTRDIVRCFQSKDPFDSFYG